MLCDVTLPRQLSPQIAMERDGVLVIDGEMIEVPGPDLDFAFSSGFRSPNDLCMHGANDDLGSGGVLRKLQTA